MKILNFKYRDGSNYKWNFNIKVSDEKFKQLEEYYGPFTEERMDNEEIEMGYDSDFGITQDDFHIKRGYDYDDEIDHNIICLNSITDNTDDEIEFDCSRTYKVHDIKYDTDGRKVKGLPKEIEIIIPYHIDNEDIEEYVSDEISNRTGYCHEGFCTTPEIL